MKFFTKKRVVLFLLFIFPLICFLLLSLGENNFTKLPVVKENLMDVSEIDATNSVKFKDNVTVVCFLGDDINKIKSGVLNLNEKIYKTFIDYKKFQIIAIYPEGQEDEVQNLKEEIGVFTDMQKWNFISSSKEEIEGFYQVFGLNEPLVNLYTSNVFLIDKDVNLRGRLTDKDSKDGKLYGYNMNSVAVLKGKLIDDIKVLYYEYYAAFKEKNKNKADRKEVGL
jgi:hypothetical protein